MGKTTLGFGLAARLKARDMSLEIVHEVARQCPLPIDETTSLEAQQLVRRELACVDLADQPRETWLDHVEEVALAKLETPQLRLI